jgi:translocation and assembly module TamA
MFMFTPATAPKEYGLPFCGKNTWKPARLSFALGVLALSVLLHAGMARAEEAFRYEVRIEVEQKYRPLLEDNLEIVRWRGNPRMNPDQLRGIHARTPEAVRELLATEGYFSPRIESSLDKEAAGWVARFRIGLGEPVRVGRVDIRLEGAAATDGAEAAALLDGMKRKWPLGPGLAFRQADWEDAKRMALQSLLTERYPAARIAHSKATVDPEQRLAELELILDSGPPFTFGELEVTGLQRYPASIVELINPVRPGEPYSQRKLLDFQSRLQDSGYFASALVDVELDPARPERVPVRVALTEVPSKKLGFGIGYGTNTGSRLQADYRDLDFANSGWGLLGKLKLETRNQSLDGEFQLPTRADDFRDSLNASYASTSIQGETTQKYAAGAKRTRVTGGIETALSLQYQLESQSVLGAGGNNVKALIAGYSWTQRRVDDPLFPTRGYVANWQVAGAKRALLSDRDFLRGYGKLSWFYPLGERDGLMLKGELGAVSARSRDDIPSDFLFRAGGEQSVRGYAYQSLGVAKGDAIVGGSYLATVTAEYTHWFAQRWGAAVFYDAGNAVDSWKNTSLARGYGIGARWKSPVGPLNLDLAYGREVRKTRLHFSVGFAF